MGQCYMDHTKRLVDGTGRNRMFHGAGVRIDHRRLRCMVGWLAEEAERERGWGEVE